MCACACAFPKRHGNHANPGQPSSLVRKGKAHTTRDNDKFPLCVCHTRSNARRLSYPTKDLAPRGTAAGPACKAWLISVFKRGFFDFLCTTPSPRPRLPAWEKPP
jgi:hypothetical protein